jgi:hypothetical protein
MRAAYRGAEKTPMTIRLRVRCQNAYKLPDHTKGTRPMKRPTPADYTPYHTFPEFDQGIDDYMSGRFENPLQRS